MIGSQRKCLQGSYYVEDLPHFKAVHCGYHTKSEYANASCGISLYLNKATVRAKDAVVIWTPQIDIRGHAAAIRVKSYYGDSACLGSEGAAEIVACHRQGPRVGREGHHRPAVAYVSSSDVNDGLGVTTGRHGPIVVESTAIGTRGLGIEHQAGAAMRELAESFDLATLDTFFPRGPSYYGAPMKARRVDVSGPSAPRGGPGAASERGPRKSEPLRPSAPRGGRGSPSPQAASSSTCTL
eukprot:1617493-Pyramimonas_sp.AAC.1